MSRGEGGRIFTIGHSNRSLPEFLELLAAHGVKKILDVRSIPRSRHNPQFGQEELRAALAEAGVGYEQLPELGGLRPARSESVNMGWHNASFRGYADYMQTAEFAQGMERLERVAREQPSALMCAEAVPWRCHRSLIGDALSQHPWQVLDITSRRTASPHRTTPFLRVENGRLWYPPG